MDARPDWTGPDLDADEPEFPVLDGPLFLLGACALVDALWAAVGEDGHDLPHGHRPQPGLHHRLLVLRGGRAGQRITSGLRLRHLWVSPG